MRGKIGGLASSVVDLFLANRYSSRFGEAVGSLLQDAKGEFPKVGDILDASSEISKHVLENVPSRESSKKILDAIGNIIENYSPEEMKEKGKTIVRSIVSMWIKDGDEAIDHLNSWLSENSKDIRNMRALNDVLLKIGGDAKKGVGLEIGGIVDTYLKALKSGKHGGEVANKFLETVFKYPTLSKELMKAIIAGNPGHSMAVLNAVNYIADYITIKDMASIEDIKIEYTCDVYLLKFRRVDVAIVEEIKEDFLTRDKLIILMEVKTGMEDNVSFETLEQIENDAKLVKEHGCSTYYYFNQVPSGRGEAISWQDKADLYIFRVE